jgi:heme exporter protein D
MDLGPHATFIVAAYAVAILIVAAMIAWVILDHLSQKRILADLEAQGLTRRSERPRGGQDVSRPAKAASTLGPTGDNA